ncbi:YegS/Rv2252/BmrU family lipid kinase [bacterium]|nr:YegS/Rv2252/BmrU family lipid kinase [bacterium]
MEIEMESILSGSRTVRLIVNGRAELGGQLKKSLQRAVRDLGERHVTVETLVTESSCDAERFAEEACIDGCAAVIAVGGDGTLYQVVNGVMKQSRGARSEVSVGVIPAGTANDFAGGLGLRSRDAYRILMALTTEQVRWLDLGKVQSRYFINFASGGFGAEATRNPPSWLKSAYGTEAYIVNGARRILALSPQQASFQSGDWCWEGRFLTFAIGNGRQAGGGCVMCPEAQLDDGELDLCIIPAHVEIQNLLNSWINGPFGIVRQLLSLQNPLRHGVVGYLLEYYKELVIRKRVSSLDICLEQPLSINLDGEPTEPRANFQITTLHQQIRYLVL